MFMRRIIGACIFSLGYYIGRESALNSPDGALSGKKNDFIKGDFTDVDVDVGGEADRAAEES